MSGGARSVLSLLTQNFLWMRSLGSTTSTTENGGCNCAEKIRKAAEKLRRLDVGSAERQRAGGVDIMLPEVEQGDGRRGGGMSRGSSRATSNPRSTGGSGGNPGPVSVAGAGGVKGDSKPASDLEDGGEIGKACQAVVDIAKEKLIDNIAQVTKKELFSA